MKYNININQYELSKNKDITIQDSAIIDWLFTMCGSDSEKIIQKRMEGWTWISLTHLINDMPLLRIKTNSGASKLVNRIKKLGFIDTKKDIKERKLYIKPTSKLRELYISPQVPQDLARVPQETARVPQDFNHNTSINTLEINTISTKVKNLNQEEKTGLLPSIRGKTYILRVLSIYNDLFKSKYGFYPQMQIGRFGKAVRNLLLTKTELQVSALLIVFFNWKGITDNDMFAMQKLIDANHNFFWFIGAINTYEIYLRNVFKLNLDDENEVRKYVSQNMLALKK